MPIVVPCPMCDLGLLRSDRIQSGFECDFCGAQMPEIPPTETPCCAAGGATCTHDLQETA